MLKPFKDLSLEINLMSYKLPYLLWQKLRIQVQKEVISYLKRGNQILVKEIWTFTWLISCERTLNRFKNWILRHMAQWQWSPSQNLDSGFHASKWR